MVRGPLVADLVDTLVRSRASVQSMLQALGLMPRWKVVQKVASRIVCSSMTVPEDQVNLGLSGKVFQIEPDPCLGLDVLMRLVY